jgi:hypothetical protein
MNRVVNLQVPLPAEHEGVISEEPVGLYDAVAPDLGYGKVQ